MQSEPTFLGISALEIGTLDEPERRLLTPTSMNLRSGTRLCHHRLAASFGIRVLAGRKVSRLDKRRIGQSGERANYAE